MKKILKYIISGTMIISMIVYTSPVFAINNKETVYSKLDSTGKNYKTIVTTKNEDETKQKNSNKELPLEAKIKYELNGKEIKPEELVGKSGKVKIHIEYKNKSSKKVMINGKEETMYTPFMVALGTIIDNKNNKNIEVSKAGKIVENGEKTIIIGMVFPGLDESLDLSGNLSEIEIPSSLDITMETSNFEMKNILTYSTPKVFKEDIKWDEFEDLFDKANELKTSTEKLEDGANSMTEGITTLNDGAKKLDKGAEKLNNGATVLKDGISSLKTGTNSLNNGAQKLAKGTSELNNGVVKLDNGANKLNGGIKELNKNIKLLTTGMSTISENLKKLNSGAEQIKQGVDGLSKELSQYASKADDIQKLINADIELRDSLKSEPENAKIVAVLDKNIESLQEELKLLKKSSGISDLVKGVDNLADGLGKLEDGTKDLPTQAEKLKVGVENLSKGSEELTKGTKELSTGAGSLNTGASNLAKGTKTIDNGVGKLSTGSKELATGTKELSKGTGDLSDGTKQLTEGAVKLQDGIHQFNIQGISKITNFINRDLKNLISRGKKLEELANEYNTFASDEKREDIGFIATIDSIKREGNSNEKGKK